MTTIFTRMAFAMLSTIGAAGLVMFVDPAVDAQPHAAPATVVAAVSAPAHNG